MALAGAIDRYLHGRALALGWQEGQDLRARDHLVGYLAGGEAGIRFSLPDDPDQVRGVDLLDLPPEQFARLKAILDEEYIPEVPALAVEVISPSEKADDVEEKVADYLAGGAHLVWLLYATRRTLRVYSPDSPAHAIGGDGVLDGGEVLPGFKVALADLFP